MLRQTIFDNMWGSLWLKLTSRWTWLMRVNAICITLLTLSGLELCNRRQIDDFLLNELPAQPRTAQEATIRVKYIYQQWEKSTSSDYRKLLLPRVKKWYEVYHYNQQIKNIYDKMLLDKSINYQNTKNKNPKPTSP